MSQASRILIVTASAGGGHMSNARALQAWIELYFPDTHVEIYDVFKHLPKIFNRDPISLFYYVLSVHAPGLWKKVVNQAHKNKPEEMDSFFKKLSPILGVKQVKRRIQEFEPDLIISTYAPAVSSIKSSLQKSSKDIPIRLVITDIFSAPPYWLGGSASSYVVMSDEAKTKVRNALPSIYIQSIPVILHPKFFVSPIKLAKKQKKNILVLAGGEGVYKLNSLVELLANTNYSITVVCGKDRLSKNELKKMKDSNQWNHVTIHGFITTIEEELQKSDLVITKAGPATLFEIFRYKKPVICYHYIYGTEQENIDFMLNHKLGIYEPDITKIPHIATDILNNKYKFASLKVNPQSKKDIQTLLKI